jgi:hypothetical protein
LEYVSILGTGDEEKVQPKSGLLGRNGVPKDTTEHCTH